MMVKTADGDLAITRDGVTFRPFAIHGSGTASTWPWPAVRRVAVEDLGRKVDRQALAFGLIGLLVRPRRVAVIVSVDDGDMVFETRMSLPALRAAARRVLDDVPAAAGKVLVGPPS